MKKVKKTTLKKNGDKAGEALRATIVRLRTELTNTKETLRAIQAGEVDALVISTEEGEKVFTLQGAEHPYRVVIETMNEGAVTLSNDGAVLYCNNRFAEILKSPMEKIVGGSLNHFMNDPHLAQFDRMLRKSRRQTVRSELMLTAASGDEVPVLASMTALKDSVKGICMVVTDIGELKDAQKSLKEANETLEQRITQRTAALQKSEAQLQISNEDLAVTNENLQQSETRYRRLFEAAKDGILILNAATGHIIDVNPFLVELLGRSREEFV
ncbi:MAG: PAS domain S-box protein, partial [Sedimentisphaerales bacterium]|nr:PAS domain S-box protein [Sedimentisphaerales bacterium]